MMLIPEFIDDKYRTKELDVRIEIIKALFNNAYVKNISIDEISNAFFLTRLNEEFFTVNENALLKFIEDTFKKTNIIYIDAVTINNTHVLRLTKTYKEIKELFDNNSLIVIKHANSEMSCGPITSMRQVLNEYVITCETGMEFTTDTENDYPVLALVV